MSYVKMGVRHKRQQAPQGRWHATKGVQPKVHLMVFDSLNKYYYRYCTDPPGFEPHGQDVPDGAPLTCKLCLRSGQS